jgi:MraZ protein
MTHFIQSQDAKVDTKGRVMFPVAYRKQLGDALSEGFFIKPSIYTKSIELHTRASWEKQLLKLQKLNIYNREHQLVIRQMLNGVREVELDGSSRLLIPREMLNYAEIDNEVVFSPMLKYLEIWNPGNFNKSIEINTPEFPDLVNKVMSELGLETD